MGQGVTGRRVGRSLVPTWATLLMVMTSVSVDAAEWMRAEGCLSTQSRSRKDWRGTACDE